MADSPIPSLATSRAWYGASIERFVHCQPAIILHELMANPEFDLVSEQRDAWQAQVALLQEALAGLSGEILLEYAIPRMGRRVDAVLLAGAVLLVVEFKVGAREFDRAALDQVWDYALDLKYFHEGSHQAPIVPILVATEARATPLPVLHADDDGVFRPVRANAGGLRGAIDLALATIRGPVLNSQAWKSAPYRPTPTIIEAARALYARHSVESIARQDAGAQNLAVTSRRIEELVDEARAANRKCICFVTGVPGAGKTLVGLNVATRRRDPGQPTHAVYLSGNAPLVAVLREALSRDELARRRALGEAPRKGRIAESVKAFIQNVHHFRDDLLSDENPPFEHVAIFDEAQRAWDLRKTADFMQRRKKRPGFSQSEPEFLIASMDRHPSWAVIVCLVGGGQEINTGEAGIGAWIEAVNQRFPHWHMHISEQLTDAEYAAGKVLSLVRGRPRTHFDNALHLAVSMRSFRAEHVSHFVKALLACQAAQARAALARLAGRYPIVLTRDLGRAKDWVRGRARGTEQYGLLASSKAHRLKPDAIDVRVNIDPVNWFLNERRDTRSSYYLEDAATEFQVQGLELDWTVVAWDADLRHAGSGWHYHAFRGDGWSRVISPARQQYLCNAYRVLLTRARQGMALYVPRGDPHDPTRAAALYDQTFNYLAGLGLTRFD